MSCLTEAKENEMKLKSLFFVIAAGIGCSALAYTWTGGGNDGSGPRPPTGA